MRVVILFSNCSDYIPLTKEGDLIVIARDEGGKVKTKLKYICTGIDSEEIPILKELETIDDIIRAADKINVNIIGHSSKGGKQIQSDATEYYPKQFISIDDIALWIEQEVLKEEITRASVSILSCEAADGKPAYPALADQMFCFFEKKPKKITARKGYVFIDKEIYSLDAFDTLVKKAMQEDKTASPLLERAAFSVLKTYGSIFKISTETKVGEKFAYYLGKDNQTYKIDIHLYHLYQSIKKSGPLSIDTKISMIINKDLENISVNEFVTLAEYGMKTSPNGRLGARANLVLNGKIKPAQIITPDLSGYEMKKAMLNSCQSLKQKIQEDNQVQNREAFNEIIDKTCAFIIYRHPRNYPIDNLQGLVSVFIRSIYRNNGKLTPSQMDYLIKFSKQISSEEQINSDASHRGGAVGIRPPSYYKEIKTVTQAKNQSFATEIDEFLNTINCNPESHLSPSWN